jgi:hypothetical protein
MITDSEFYGPTAVAAGGATVTFNQSILAGDIDISGTPTLTCLPVTSDTEVFVNTEVILPNSAKVKFPTPD